MQLQRPSFPEYIDSTMRASFVSCKRKFFNEYLLNRRSGRPNVHLNAGAAFAKGTEVVRKRYYDDGVEADTAILDGQVALIKAYKDAELFEGEKKSLPVMVEALYEYFHHYGLDGDHYKPFLGSDSKSAVEFSFSIPLDGTRHPTSGSPILYCGRFDWVAQHQDTGDLFAADDKTASQLGATWPNQWRHRAQLTGYVWAGRQFDLDLRGALVRGISILAKGFGHAESLQLRSEVYIERWLNQLKRDIADMVQCWEEGYFDYDFGEACTSYSSPCAYTDSCSSSRPEDYVKANFEHVRWNPIEHVTEELDDQDNVVGYV